MFSSSEHDIHVRLKGRYIPSERDDYGMFPAAFF